MIVLLLYVPDIGSRRYFHAWTHRQINHHSVQYCICKLLLNDPQLVQSAILEFLRTCPVHTNTMVCICRHLNNTVSEECKAKCKGPFRAQY